MLENTLENKAKLFAQYWGQNVLNFNEPNTPNAGCFEVDGSIDEYCLLELTPLSQITDEDALECYNLHFLSHLKNDVRPNESRIQFAKKYIVKPIEVCIPIVIDYLRSKGYALPYMGLSVEKLVKYGWIKIEYENTTN